LPDILRAEAGPALGVAKAITSGQDEPPVPAGI
jgi:hypothetical protein